MTPPLPASWLPIIGEELDKPYFQKLQAFVTEERSKHAVFPPEPDVYNALNYTPYENVNVLLLGQDPYHDDGQAHGLCFSVRPGIRPPPSLVNMFSELKSDLGCRVPNNGYLVSWAQQGILMLNAVLTVVVVQDAKQWSSYNVKPLTFVHSPRSQLYAGPQEVVGANLDYIISTQKFDGGWGLTWSWEERNPAAWKLAEKEWRSVLTLENLQTLAAFHRLTP